MKKFKFHWGWSILLVYTIFITVFLFYFYKSFQELKTNELVEKDYYEKELKYGEIIEKIHNSDTMKTPLKIIQNSNGIIISFPNYIDKNKFSGKVTLYKPDNKKLDQIKNIILDDNYKMLIDKKNFISGRWNINIDWEIDKTSYYKEEKLIIN